MQDVIKEIISRHLGKVLINEKISNYTTYKVGGKVRAICYPKGIAELIELVSFLKEKKDLVLKKLLLLLKKRIQYSILLSYLKQK